MLHRRSRSGRDERNLLLLAVIRPGATTMVEALTAVDRSLPRIERPISVPFESVMAGPGDLERHHLRGHGVARTSRGSRPGELRTAIE